MINGIVSGDTDNEGVIEAIPKRKAEDLVQVIRSRMHIAVLVRVISLHASSLTIISVLQLQMN